MNATDSLAIVNTSVTSLKDNYSVILPVIFGVIIVVAVLFWAWRKLHSAAKGRA